MKTVHIVFGTQGAGKSTYSKALAAKVNGVHLSIDDWMWELFGSDLPKPIDIAWLMERLGRCENRIWKTTMQIVACGTNVILDLGFMKVKNRNTFLDLASQHQMLTQLHYVDAPYETRLKRVMERNNAKGKTFSFEVSAAAFNYMEQQFEKPSEVELQRAVIVDTGEEILF